VVAAWGRHCLPGPAFRHRDVGPPWPLECRSMRHTVPEGNAAPRPSIMQQFSSHWIFLVYPVAEERYLNKIDRFKFHDKVIINIEKTQSQVRRSGVGKPFWDRMPQERHSSGQGWRTAGRRRAYPPPAAPDLAYYGPRSSFFWVPIQLIQSPDPDWYRPQSTSSRAPFSPLVTLDKTNTF